MLLHFHWSWLLPMTDVFFLLFLNGVKGNFSSPTVEESKTKEGKCKVDFNQINKEEWIRLKWNWNQTLKILEELIWKGWFQGHGIWLMRWSLEFDSRPTPPKSLSMRLLKSLILESTGCQTKLEYRYRRDHQFIHHQLASVNSIASGNNKIFHPNLIHRCLMVLTICNKIFSDKFCGQFRSYHYLKV